MPTSDNSQDLSRDIEPVSLLIGGKLHNSWTRYSVDSDMMRSAAAWNVSLGMPAGEIPPAVEVGAAVEVRIGRDTVMMGMVDEVEDDISGQAATFAMSGRDGASVLVDCSAPLFSAKDLTLDQIVRSIVNPLGISKVRVNANGQGIAEKVNIEPGDSAWDALERAARANGLWPWFAPDGTLIVGGPDYEAPPVASLILKLDGQGNNISRLRRTVSIAKRYSEITLLGQSHGTTTADGRNGMRTIVKDPAVRLYRPKIMVASDASSTAALSRQANKELADCRLDGLSYQAEVRGHRTSNGQLWTPGQRVHLISERHNVKAVFFIMARRFQGGRGTPSKTLLTLKEDQVWIPVVVPTKSGKGRGTKAFSPQELGTLS